MSVSDDGAGIPESFDFKTSTGFGLTMIRGMAFTAANASMHFVADGH